MENFVDRFSVCHHILRGMDQNIVHVDCEPILSQFFGEYRVHHCLECSWGVCESKEHDSWFEQSLICDEGCFPLIAFLDMDVIVSPSDVKL